MSDLSSPDRRVTIGGKEYTLDGSFRTLKAIQHACGDRDILAVLVDAIQFKLRFEQLADLIRVGVEGGGETPPDIAVIEQAVVEDIGIGDAQALVMEWLMAATSPRKEREGNVKGLRDALAAEKTLRTTAARKKPGSRGGNTASSASA